MALGENDSHTTSAQRTRSRISSLASGLSIATVRPSFPALRFWKRPLFSEPPSLLSNGWNVRAPSSLCEDSTRTTVAPQSASTRVAAGPAITHMRSRILTSESGAVGSASATEVGSTTRVVILPLSWPMAGGGRDISSGVAENLAIGPGNRTGPTSGHSISRQKSRSAYWPSSETSWALQIGTISRRLSMAVDSNSAFVFVAENSAATSWMRSYSPRPMRPVVTPSTKFTQSISRSLSLHMPSS